ncbi:MAG: hypothetical protein FWC33_00565 [Candidatus Bathyarchaeota archaeon]|nr:hypothetical protein [Candidatus Termiticorpusculum sp.]
MPSNRKSDKSVSVPASDHDLISAWIRSGKSHYVSTDEAYRDAIRDIIYDKTPNTNSSAKQLP